MDARRTSAENRDHVVVLIGHFDVVNPPPVALLERPAARREHVAGMGRGEDIGDIAERVEALETLLLERERENEKKEAQS